MSYLNTNLNREQLICTKCKKKTAVEFVTSIRVYNGVYCRNCDNTNYYAAMRQQAKERKAQRLARTGEQN